LTGSKEALDDLRMPARESRAEISIMFITWMCGQQTAHQHAFGAFSRLVKAFFFIWEKSHRNHDCCHDPVLGG
jgi:hypothetical protein